MIDRPPKRFFEFEQFRIDVEERRLLREEDPIPLTPKVFDILLTLVENNGHTVAKEELLESVWADSFVEEGSLNRNVSTLRKVLGEDSHRPRFITTVPKRGYRFDGDVREVIEEDEAFVVEKRTRYKVSMSEKTEVASGFSRRSALIFAAAGLLVLLWAGWAMFRPASSDANSLGASERISKNSEAAELYKKARASWQNRSVEGLYQATVDLERAVGLDPNFALAHAALADAYAFDVINWKKAEATAIRAMELDGTLGQPHATIGFVRTFWEGRLNEADAHFRRAIDLDPDYATAHQWYALNLTARSSGGSGLGEIMRAAEIEPNSAAIGADYCQILYLSRKYDQALDRCLKTIAIDPNLIAAHRHLYEIYTAKRMYPEAVASFIKAEELSMTTKVFPGELERLRRAFESGGIREFWRERIRMTQNREKPHAYALGQYYARLGENDEALKWFEAAAQTPGFETLFFAVDPVSASLFADPRASTIAAKLKLR